MEKGENLEKDYTQQSIIASLALHCVLLLLCLLFVLRTPIPPYGAGMGVELNYGTVDEGFGDVQTLNKANPSPVKEEAAPANDEEEQKPIEKEEEREEEEVVEKTPEPVKQKVTEEKIITTEDEESKTYIKKTEETPKKATPPPAPAKKPQVDQRAVFGSGTSNGTAGNKEQIAGNNNGDRPGKVGDQGDERGTVDAKALYGNPGTGGDGPGGSGGGPKLDMVGWMWDTKPVVKDETSETGKIVFEIKINSDGELLSVRNIDKTVSPSVVQYYEREIRKLTFTKTSPGQAPPTSTGRITIIITSR